MKNHGRKEPHGTRTRIGSSRSYINKKFYQISAGTSSLHGHSLTDTDGRSRPITKKSFRAGIGSTNPASEKERRKLKLLDIVPHAILCIANGEIIYSNRHVTDLFGWERDELLGKEPSILFVGDDVFEAIQRRFESTFTNETIHREECVCRRQDGTCIPCVVTTAWAGEYTGMAIHLQTFVRLDYRMSKCRSDWTGILSGGKIVERDKEGPTLHTAGTHRQITDMKIAEQNLTESEAIFRRLIELTTDIVWEVDDQERFTYISPRFNDVTGYNQADVIGHTPYSFLMEKNAGSTAAAFRRLKKRGASFAFVENRLRCKNGMEVIFENSGYPLFDAKGQLRGYRGVFRDVTERRQAEDELKQKDIELKEANANLREVNAALRAILEHHEKEKQEMEDKFLNNINKLIRPYIEKIKQTKIDEYQAACLNMMEKNLMNVISPFIMQVSQQHNNLTPREIQVANHIREGRTSKEIALVMNVSPSAIELHRNHIRSKLGISKKKINLRSYLLSLS